MDARSVTRYLARIGAPRPRTPTAEALRDLHRRHLIAIPFENLSIHLGQPIVLEEDALVRKLVADRRGGFCYELNGAFAALLGALGFPVTLLAGGVYGEDGLSPPFAHMALKVEADGPWLADVGFGDHTLHPLRMDVAGPQDDPAGTFQIVPADVADVAGGSDPAALDVLRDGKANYRVETMPRRLEDFVPMCWWQQTWPASHFRRGLVCTLPVAGGRLTLSGRRLIRTVGGERTETALGSDEEVLAAYQDLFGISLDAVPEVAGESTNPNQQAK